MSRSSWLIGSIVGLADQDITVDADGAGASAATVAFAYDGTYLEHATAGLSMMGALEAELQSEGVTNASVFLTQSGYVRITADVSFVIVWTDTALRDALGFTGTVTDTSAPFDQTAPNRSPYLWVPRKNDNPDKAPLGVSGAEKHNTATFVASDGTTVTRTFGDPIRDNRLSWRFIHKDQFWDSTEAAGQLQDFYNRVLSPGAKLRFHRDVTADYTSATAVTLGTAIGPYVKSSSERALPMRRSQGFGSVDCRYDFTLDTIVTPEYGS